MPERGNVADIVRSLDSMLELCDSGFVQEGVNFGKYGFPVDRLRKKMHSYDKSVQSMISDDIVERFLEKGQGVEDDDFQADDTPWFLPEGTYLTKQMIQNRNTMRALTVAIALKPSEKVKEKLLKRAAKLFQKDIIYAIPFLGFLEDFAPTLNEEVGEKMDELLGKDEVVDKIYLDNIGGYSDKKWALPRTLKAAQNPSMAPEIAQPYSGSYFDLQQLEWYPKVKEAARVAWANSVDQGTSDSSQNESHKPPKHDENGYIFATNLTIAAD